MSIQNGRLVIFPDIFPRERVCPGDETVHYVSWPSWERCVAFFADPNQKEVRNPPMNIDLRADFKKGSVPLLVGEPQNFLRSLATLKDGLPVFDPANLALPPKKEEAIEDIKKAIVAQPIRPVRETSDKSGPPRTTVTFVPHLSLALWTLGELQSDDSERLFAEAKAKRKSLAEELRGPAEAEVTGSSSSGAAAEGKTEPAGEDKPPEVSGLSPKSARCVFDCFFFLGKEVLVPGDLIFTPYADLPELLETRFRKHPERPGVFLYDAES
ncbi:MAG: hypothetical protein LBF41_01490 [Deltaproteobacteria bacterium]|jgi:hypothetical protein|nr:hypothetical protein [Deltaproteobacteria bacterium]